MRGVLAGLVATGERGGEVLGVALAHADEGLVHAREHGAGADLVGDALDGVDLLAVDLGLEVDGDEVAVLDGAVDAGEGAEALAQLGHPGLDVLVADGHRVDGDLESVVGGEGELGTDVHLDGEDELLAVGERQLGHLDLGLAEGLEVLLLDGLAEELGERLVDGLLEDRGLADPLLDDAGGHLPGAEAGDLDLAADGLQGRVDVRLQLLAGDLDGHLHPGRVELLDGTLHCWDSKIWEGMSGIGHAPPPAEPQLSSPHYRPGAAPTQPGGRTATVDLGSPPCLPLLPRLPALVRRVRSCRCGSSSVRWPAGSSS